MTYRRALPTTAVLVAFALAACGGSVFSTAGDGDASGGGDGDTGGDGDGTTPGDGDTVGDGDGDTGGDGDVTPTEGLCERDEDCVAVWVTDAACYSPGCDVPRGASVDDVVANPCLVEWNGDEINEAAEECRPVASEPVVCAASCAEPPLCVQAFCGTNGCDVRTFYEEADCSSPGTGGGSGTDGCAALDVVRSEALEEARKCVPDGIIAECTTGASINNECGCPVLVNENQVALVTAAREAYDAWNSACEPPSRCALADCVPTSDTGSCVPKSGEQATCSW